MTIAEDFQALRDKATAELTQVLAARTQIDEQIKVLRAQRRQLDTDIARARGALKFAEVLNPSVENNPSPALERAKAATETETPPSGLPSTPGPSEPEAPPVP